MAFLILSISVAFNVFIFGYLNRARGDDSWKPSWLRGRALYYVSFMVGLFSYFETLDWKFALLFALTYLFWGVFSWGYTIGGVLGYIPARPPTRLEAFLDRFSAEVALWLRMFFVFPGMLAVMFVSGHNDWLQIAIGVSVAFASWVIATYIILSHKYRADKAWAIGEYLTGAWWGLTLSFLGKII